VTFTERDKRALWMLGVVGGGLLLWYFTTAGDKSEHVVDAVESIPMAEKRLTKLRQIAAAAPGREEALRQVTAELSQREAGLIKADTAAQAQAQIVQALKRLGKQQSPAIDIRNTEIGQAKPYSEDYGEVSVTVSFDTRIEQLVNFLSDLSAQKELIATSEMHIGAAHAEEKVMPVRLTVSALVRRQLIPEKKGGTAF
jgi:General secretion pathway protein M.